MTKAALLAQTWDRVSRHRRHILRKDVALVFDTAIGLLVDHLVKHGKRKPVRVAVPGLGIFQVRARAQREGRHPQNGQPIIIPRARKLVFREAKEVREDLNRAPMALPRPPALP